MTFAKTCKSSEFDMSKLIQPQKLTRRDRRRIRKHLGARVTIRKINHVDHVFLATDPDWNIAPLSEFHRELDTGVMPDVGFGAT